MRTRIVFLCLFFIVNACGQQDQNGGPFIYLALGDSYTIGQSVAEDERWPLQLIEEIKNSYPVEETEVDIIARTGWTTKDLISGIQAQYEKGKIYDMVSLLIGVNNQYRHLDINSYTPDFTELLETAIEFAGNDRSRVFVVSIPDYSFTPSHEKIEGISEDIDNYNEINKRISEEYGVIYVDITGISRQGLDIPELVAEDALHPSGKQYADWVENILPQISSILDQEFQLEE